MPGDALNRRSLFRLEFLPRPPARADYDGAKAAIAERWEGDAGALLRAWEPLAPVLCDAAGIAPGMRVMDAATGDGNVALEAARRGAIVTGCDVVPAQLDRARARAEGEGLDVLFARGDVEGLLDWDETYDAVLSAYGATLAPRPKRTIRELLRILKPGGTLVLAAPAPHSFAARLHDLARFPGIPSPADWGREEIAVERVAAVAPGVEVETCTRHFALRFESEAAAWAAHARPFGLPDAMRDAFADLVSALSDSASEVQIDERVTLVIARR